MARKSGNPVFSLILNDFTSIFSAMAMQYFTEKKARLASLRYYQELSDTIKDSGRPRVEDVVKKAMAQSIAIWKEVKRE
jgi:DNA-binding FadR family transcriptional regulator